MGYDCYELIINITLYREFFIVILGFHMAFQLYSITKDYYFNIFLIFNI